jgi:hypothetical protein
VLDDADPPVGIKGLDVRSEAELRPEAVTGGVGRLRGVAERDPGVGGRAADDVGRVIELDPRVDDEGRGDVLGVPLAGGVDCPAMR